MIRIKARGQWDVRIRFRVTLTSAAFAIAHSTLSSSEVSLFRLEFGSGLEVVNLIHYP